MFRMSRIPGGKWSVLAFSYFVGLFLLYGPEGLAVRINSPVQLLLVSSVSLLMFPAILLAAFYSLRELRQKSSTSFSVGVIVWIVWIVGAICLLAGSANSVVSLPRMEPYQDAARREFLIEVKKVVDQ